MQQFYGSSAKAARDPEGDRLTGLDQKLYDALKGLLMDAAASGGSTDFTIPASRASSGPAIHFLIISYLSG